MTERFAVFVCHYAHFLQLHRKCSSFSFNILFSVVRPPNTVLTKCFVMWVFSGDKDRVPFKGKGHGYEPGKIVLFLPKSYYM